VRSAPSGNAKPDGRVKDLSDQDSVVPDGCLGVIDGRVFAMILKVPPQELALGL
jgi:hypothetical protein